MRGFSPMAAVACLMLIAGAGCGGPKTFKPSGPLPVGTLLFHFSAKVAGPVDLELDGIRIPVTPSKKQAQNLVITGLSAGTHRFFLASPRDAFGPDHGDITMPQDQGTYLDAFAQHFNAVLYGSPDPIPPSPGIPGVMARMVP